MAEAILIPISLFLTIFGIVYLFLSTRNKERLALIEKGVDASIFRSNRNSFQKIIILNLALLFMGIGIGVFIALLLATYTSLDKGALYPAMVFLMAGVSLFIGFKMTNTLDK
jgi:flagellar biosynthesis protein FliQ